VLSVEPRGLDGGDEELCRANNGLVRKRYFVGLEGRMWV
jgi:hypothetical protein